MRFYLYHYHAFVQQTPATMTHLDGVVNTDKPILTYADLKAVKAKIASDDIPVERMTLSTITYLGREPWRACLSRVL